MQDFETRLLYTPTSESLRFLPEGPYPCPDGKLSWVAIQHGPGASEGSLNILDLNQGTNHTIPLHGRPGFAFPTTRKNVFVVGLERRVALVDITTGVEEVIVDEIDAHVDGTIINDAVTFDGHLVFGCKDLTFSEKKAGLYLLRRGEGRAIQLLDDQVCSNGKAVVTRSSGSYRLYDICSHSQQVLAWDLDLAQGKLSHPATIVDLTNESVAPDGMIMTPDQKHLIIAIYDPRDVVDGQARMYEIETGQLVAVWHCRKSPRVTCPQLIDYNGQIKLVLTTADEGMSPAHREKCSHAGCLFLGDTTFDAPSEAPLYPV